MDVMCIVCGEPWDQYHVMHDMPKWQARLFNIGAGCPCCEGVGHPDDDVFVEALSSRLINGSDEGEAGGAIAALTEDHDLPRPKWEQPKPKLKWECACCNCKIVDGYDYYDGFEEVQVECPKDMDIHSKMRREEMDLTPAGVEDGYQYCEECWVACDQCGEGMVTGSGYHRQEGMRVYEYCCEECLSAAEYEDAQETWDNCSRRDVQRTLVPMLEEWLEDKPLLADWDADDLADELIDTYIEVNGTPDYETHSDGAHFDIDKIANDIFDWSEKND